MAISVKNYNLLSINGIDKINPVNANPATADNQNTFIDLLRDSLQKTAASTSGATFTPTLTKDQLDLLVKTIQSQMRRQLFNAVFNNGEETNYFPSRMLPVYTNGVAPASVEVSKKCQIPPKNNNNVIRYDVDTFVEKAAHKYDVDPNLIRSVIKAESNFNSQATSPKGAMGLMQLMPETARDLGVKNAYDPEENIMGGTRYLKSLLDRYDGKVDLTLAAYNWGMGNVEKNPQKLPRETVNYIARVNGHYRNFKSSA